MNSSCDQMQLAVLNGRVSAAVRDHARHCSECRFFAELSAVLEGLGSQSSLSSLEETAPGLPGDTFLDRYEIVEIVGRGGQGVVCRARDRQADDEVAIKFVKLTTTKGTVRELAHARRIRHPNVCRVFDTRHDEPYRMIIMEYIDGPSLAEVRHELSRARALRMFREICEGVKAAHDAGVLHLDLTPRNVMLRDRTQPVITDFGLSVARVDGARAQGGTTGFMAPEQRRGADVDERADIYALGRLLAWLVDTRLGWINMVIRRATHADAESRFDSVEEVLRVLDVPRRRRRRALALVITTGMVVLATLVATKAIEPPGGPRAPMRQEDSLPQHLWNVGRKTADGRMPRVKFSHPLFGCGNKPADLFDGFETYVLWNHGVAFPPPPIESSPNAFCFDLVLLGECGTLEPNAVICEDLDWDDEHYRVLPLRGRDIDLASIQPRDAARLGKLVPRVECGIRTVTVELERPHALRAARAWFHAAYLPLLNWVEVVGSSGSVSRYVYDKTGRPLSSVVLDRGSNTYEGHGATSWPITIDFPRTEAQTVSWSFDTCTTLHEVEFERYLDGETWDDGRLIAPDVGWLYELEIFAEPEWYEAWYWFLFDR